jgi:hypothetical protein
VRVVSFITGIASIGGSPLGVNDKRVTVRSMLSNSSVTGGGQLGGLIAEQLMIAWKWLGERHQTASDGIGNPSEEPGWGSAELAGAAGSANGVASGAATGD